jgi:glycosyltransferase involved in cell wall biosynthesis
VSNLSDPNTGSRKFTFFSLSSTKTSRTRNYYRGIQSKNLEVSWVDTSFFDLCKSLIRKDSEIIKGENRTIIVCSPSHILVLPFVFFRGIRPHLDAGWPLFDGVISSRRQYGFLGFNLIKTYLIDFLAFHLSLSVIIESNEQKKRVIKRYFLSSNKVHVVLTGFDESRFRGMRVESINVNDNSQQVLMRGSDQEEAGISFLIEAANLARVRNLNLFFRVITNSDEKKVVFENLKFSSNRILDEELFKEYCSSQIALGQLSNHPRINWTIPHKFFEAAYLGVPYLSASSGPMRDLAEDNCVALFEGGNPIDLLNRIVELISDKSKQDLISENIKAFYEEYCSQSVLTEKFLSIITKP